MANKFRVIFSTVALAVATGCADASVVNSISGGTVIAMPVTNTFGSGPITQAPGITWSSTTANSVFGNTNGYYFNDNGFWDSGLTMVGVNATNGTMTYSFANPLSAVGGFINYALIGGAPVGSNPSIAIYNSANQLLESTVLNFSTGGGTDSGFFYGFDDATSSIAYFTLSNAYIGLADLTIKDGTPSAVPLPAAAPLFLSGLGVLGFTARRRKQTV